MADHLQSPSHRAGSKVSIESHFSLLWISLTQSRRPGSVTGRASLFHFCPYLKGIYQLASTDDSAGHSTAGASNDVGDLLWYAIVCQHFIETPSVQDFKRLLIIGNLTWTEGFHLHNCAEMIRSIAVWSTQEFSLRSEVLD